MAGSQPIATPPSSFSFPLTPSIVRSAWCAVARVVNTTPLACASQRWWQWAAWTVYVVQCSVRLCNRSIVWCNIGTLRSLMHLNMNQKKKKIGTLIVILHTQQEIVDSRCEGRGNDG